jgi:hypothetical protein
MRKRAKDFELTHAASRRRMQSLGTAVVPGPITIPAHTHSADQITFEPYGLTAADDVQEMGEEHDVEKLARSGVQPMQGDLNMDDGLGPWEIDNIKNLNMSGGVGAAILNLVRNIVMTGIGWIENVKRIHFIGDDDDGDALIDGLERVVFNNEPTKSVIQNPSTIEFNPAVTPGSDTAYLEAQFSYSDTEQAVQLDVGEQGGGYDVRNTLGWVDVRWENNTGGDIDPLRVLYSINASVLNFPPLANFFDRTAGGPWDTSPPWLLPSFGVSKHFSGGGEGDIWVMQRGILRGYPDTLLDAYSVGDVLWAKGEDGLITNVRPTYQNAPLVRIGKVIAESGGTIDLEIDVTVLPLVDALPGPSWQMVLAQRMFGG